MLIRVMRRRQFRTSVALTTLFCVQGCYSYVPAPTGMLPAPGQRVRVNLTPEGTTDLARYLGPNVTAAEGTLTETRPADTLVVAVDYVRLSNGLAQQWAGEGVVFFPGQYRASLETRALQKRRSVVAGVALGIALVTTAIVALRSVGAGGGTEQPPPPPP